MRDLFLLAGGISLILLRFWFGGNQKLVYTPGQSVHLVGRIVQEPRVQDWQQSFLLGKFEVVTSRWPEFHFGDKVEVAGKIIQAENLPSGTLYGLEATEVRLLGKGVSLFLPYTLRVKAEEIYQKVLPEPQASLLLGIVWGGQGGLTKELSAALKSSGTTHVVAASGMNVTMVAGFLLGALVIFLPKGWAIPLALLVIWGYVLAAGGTPSVVRAGIMAVVFYLAQVFGRQYNGVRILVGTAILMLLVSPRWLFDVGWQLSVAATAGLLTMGKVSRDSQGESLRRQGLSFKSQGLPVVGGVWKLVVGDFRTSLVALLATLPILVANFGRLSVLAPLVNALVLWTIAPLMVIGFLVVIVGLIWLPLAQVTGWAAWALLSYFIWVVEFFGKMNWASLEGLRVSWWWGVGYYMILGAALILTKVKIARRRKF